MKVILSKDRTTDQFTNIQSGNLEDLVPQYELIKSLLSEELRTRIEALISKSDETEADSSADTEQSAELPQPSMSKPDTQESSES